MVDIDARVTVTDEFLHIHQVISAETIKARCVGGLDNQQRKRQVARDISGVKPDIGIPERSQIPAFRYRKPKGIVVVLAAQQAFYPHRILQAENRVLRGNGPARIAALIELLMRGPAERERKLRGCELRNGISQAGLRLIDVIEGLRRLLQPVPDPEVIGKMIPEFPDIR